MGAIWLMLFVTQLRVHKGSLVGWVTVAAYVENDS